MGFVCPQELLSFRQGGSLGAGALVDIAKEALLGGLCQILASVSK